MKNKTKRVLFNWSFFIIVITIIFGLHFSLQKKEIKNKISINSQGFGKIGNIEIDTVKKQIQFKAKVLKNQGWVQHLIYLEGYRWLKQESAIISEEKLIDLQQAIACIDTPLWNELWHKKKVKTKKIYLFVQWGGKKIKGEKLVLSEDELSVNDFIFLGFPSFDCVALKSLSADCKSCPLFALEKKILREEFKKKSGKSGYQLNTLLFPAKETEISVIIQIKDLEK